MTVGELIHFLENQDHSLQVKIMTEIETTEFPTHLNVVQIEHDLRDHGVVTGQYVVLIGQELV